MEFHSAFYTILHSILTIPPIFFPFFSPHLNPHDPPFPKPFGDDPKMPNFPSGKARKCCQCRKSRWKLIAPSPAAIPWCSWRTGRSWEILWKKPCWQLWTGHSPKVNPKFFLQFSFLEFFFSWNFEAFRVGKVKKKRRKAIPWKSRKNSVKSHKIIPQKIAEIFLQKSHTISHKNPTKSSHKSFL